MHFQNLIWAMPFWFLQFKKCDSRFTLVLLKSSGSYIQIQICMIKFLTIKFSKSKQRSKPKKTGEVLAPNMGTALCSKNWIIVPKINSLLDRVYRFYKTLQEFCWYVMMSFNISLAFLMILPKLTPFYQISFSHF